MKNRPGQRVHSLLHESYGKSAPHMLQAENLAPPLFDELSAIAGGVLLLSTSVLLYAVVPAFEFDAVNSVAGHISGPGEGDSGWRFLEPISRALE